MIKADRRIDLGPDMAASTDHVPPRNLTIYTTYHLEPDDPGITLE